ncbi:MAG: helix-turn-helix transcriptional regulator [Bacilli bacterium]|nr:helix-turn-helix domain-containing protein [Acholeplasmataceae bacterium]MDY2902634.1 helix-turn-helix transcriptional regulator [Bacilli bacterium]
MDENKMDLEKDLRKEIINQLVDFRKQKKLTQKDIAEKLGVTQQQVAKIEKLSNSPTLTVITKYAQALDLKFDIKIYDDKK